MYNILDQGMFWKLNLNKNISPTVKINRPKKGYIAQIGIDINTGLKEISFVRYYKIYTDSNGTTKSRSIDDVKQKVEDFIKYKLNHGGS